MNNLNHTALIREVAAESGQPDKIVEQVLRALFDVIGRHVISGFRVSVTNFGTWYRSTVAPRTRSNPETGEEWRAPRTNYPRFKFSPRLREATVSGQVPATLKKRGRHQVK